VQRIAVWDALGKIAMSKRIGTPIRGYAGTIRDIDIQVDLD
jgi:hypothetical protein